MSNGSVNKVILIGNLGQDPEVRYMPSGGAVTNLTLATSDTWRDKQSGEQKERTEWHRVVLFGKIAEVAGEYLRKGAPVYIEGRLQTRKWQDTNGQDRYTTEVVVDVGGSMQMLGGRQQGQQANPQGQGQPQGQNRPQGQGQPQGQNRPQGQGQSQGQNRPQGQGQQRGGYNRQAAQPQSAPPVYNEPPMDFDENIPFRRLTQMHPQLLDCM